MTRPFGHLFRRGDIWWVQFRVDGQRIRESSHSTRKSDAQRVLRQRNAEIYDGRYTPDNDRLTFDELEQIIVGHYAPKRSMKRVSIALRHLRSHLGLYKVKALTFDCLTAYRNDRLAEGAAPASVKYELATLGKGLTIAVRSGKLLRRPPMPEHTVNNVRQGFFERPEFEAVLAELPSELRGMMQVAFLTGWRVPSELMPMQWRQVDFTAGVMRLEPGTTKNNEGREFPFDVLSELQTTLEAQQRYTRKVEKRTHKVVPWVFHRNGVPIRDCYTTWRSACERAGVPGKLMHDFRRTSVRNLERAGVPRSVAMKLVGHKTESVFQRYAIVSEADLREGASKLAQLPKDVERKVLLFGTTIGPQQVGLNV